MQNSPSDLFLFWAKTPQKKGAPPHWHPLLCHMLDVGAVLDAMWRDVISPWERAWVADALGVDEDTARAWITFWGAAHDIGKASPAFQFQYSAKEQQPRLREAGYAGNIVTAPHGTISAAVLARSLTEAFHFSEHLACYIAVAVGGHHGIFPTVDDVQEVASSVMGKGQWEAARDALLAALADCLGVPRDRIPGTATPAAVVWIAGLISVADWIGSNQDYFSLIATNPDAAPALVPLEYLADTARPAARDALQRLGWLGTPRAEGARPFEEVFGFAPNPVQETVHDALPEALPALLIVEAPMGVGKTEAALWVAEAWGAAQGQEGLYFALPTQATSNQMFHRLREYLEKRFPHTRVNTQLLHGLASLSGEFQELQRNEHRLFEPSAVDEDSSDASNWSGPPSVLAAGWFTHRKRGLLAPFGVGTIDQALLAVLQTRHVFVRLFGLGGKVVIVDEVHAYDTYMSTLLEQLLRWLAALGTSVVLLSATLPDDRRRALTRAYMEGLGEAGKHVPGATYPRMTWVGAGMEPAARSLPSPDDLSRRLRLQWIDGLSEARGSTDALGRRLEDALRSGGCVAVICNTVHRAQDVFRGLQCYFKDSLKAGKMELDLFHARFPFEERDRREKETLLRFGKPGAEVEFGPGDVRTVQRPERAILVATQVIEQSLDLDFDLMVTDMAPADLLLQRAGRVHRHARQRPPGLEEPTLWVGRPTVAEDGVPVFDRGTTAVYDAHVLLRTWLVLKDRGLVELPTGIAEVIEAVYDDRPCPEELSEALRQAWHETAGEKVKEMTDDANKARVRDIPVPEFKEELHALTSDWRDDDEPQVLTRLGEVTVTIVCLYGDETDAYLDRDRRRRAALSGKPSTREAEQLLRRSVRLGSKRVLWSLLRLPAPHGWEESALLRHCRPVYFDDASCAAMKGTKYRLRLDEEIGICIEEV